MVPTDGDTAPYHVDQVNRSSVIERVGKNKRKYRVSTDLIVPLVMQCSPYHHFLSHFKIVVVLIVNFYEHFFS